MATIKGAGSKNTGKGKTITEDLFDALRPDAMISNAQKVLSSAVNILEEEIAAGIVAAKKIEKKVINVDGIRENPEDLMNRIRKDTHEAVDLFLDALTAITRQMGILSGNIAKESGTFKEKNAEKNNNNEMAVVENDTPALPGEKITLFITLSHDNTGGPVTILFQKADLISGNNRRIPAAAVKFTPAAITLAPGENRQMAIHIKIPKNCQPGKYSALLIDANDSFNRIVLGLHIA
jgi:hypothetical protein